MLSSLPHRNGNRRRQNHHGLAARGGFAFSGRPVHVVTVERYLAERDAEQLRPVYEALGLTVGLVVHGQQTDERRAAYAADITYCTNKDLVFDYLRDRMTVGRHRGQPRQMIKALTAESSLGEPNRPLLRGLHVRDCRSRLTRC